jgi:hypothetical protein
VYPDICNALTKAGKYEAALDLASKGMAARPADTKGLIALQKIRVTAFTGLKKFDQVASAARGYYCICSVSDTEAAAKLVASNLAAAKPGEEDIASRLLAEQADRQAGKSPPAFKQPGLLEFVALQPPPSGVDPLPPAAESDRMIAQGNLLLLTGKAAEASDSFSKASVAAKGDAARTAATTEGMARAKRTADGFVPKPQTAERPPPLQDPVTALTARLHYAKRKAQKAAVPNLTALLRTQHSLTVLRASRTWCELLAKSKLAAESIIVADAVLDVYNKGDGRPASPFAAA